MQLEGLVDLTFADERRHVYLNRASNILISNGCVEQLNETHFPLIATLAVLIERALPREEEIELVNVPVLIHLKRLADLGFGPARPSKLENERRLYIDLEGRNLQLDGTLFFFGTDSG